ncbi:MAG: ROK family protein [Pseudomonadota bacterium]
MKFVAIVTRTLKAGKSYDDYRKAWFHSRGFGVPTQMYTVVNTFNPREIISIGIIDCTPEELTTGLEIEVADRLGKPMDDVIETTVVRTFGLVAAVDDFSAKGELTYVPPSIDGVPQSFDEIAGLLETVAGELRAASARRDELKAAR